MTFDVTPFDVTLADVQAAAARIAGKVRRTPTYHSVGLSERLGVETWIKLESLQLGGSFKVRGCFNKLSGLSEAQLRRGVVTVSGGIMRSPSPSSRALSARGRWC